MVYLLFMFIKLYIFLVIVIIFFIESFKSLYILITIIISV